MDGRHRQDVEGGVEAVSPSVAITMGAALWARKIATSLATSSALLPDRPAAHTRIIGSDERSMCFLSSVTSQAMDL